MYIPRLVFLLLIGVGFAVARAKPLDDAVAAFYRPWQGEHIALSPDGELLAYTRYRDGELAIFITPVSRTAPPFKIAVADDQPLRFSREKAPARLRFLAWASSTRLVFAPESYFNGVRVIAPIIAVNADGTAPQTLAVPDDFKTPDAFGGPDKIRPTTLLGFVAGRRDSLLVLAAGGSSPVAPVTTTLFSINVTTGKITALSEGEDPGRYLADPLGHLRLVYTRPRLDLEHVFRWRGPGPRDRWRDLDPIAAGPVARAFTTTPANYFAERAFPLGFASDPDLLYYASNVGGDTFGVYALDLRTRLPTTFALEDPRFDLVGPEPASAPALVCDPVTGRLAGVRAVGLAPFTRWVDPELAGLQAELDRKFPQRTVEILQWDDARRRFLLRITGGADPGRYQVYLRPEKLPVELVRAAPWLLEADLHRGTTFEFDVPGGGRLSGYLTLPRRPRLTPPPLLIDFADGMLERPKPGFDRETQMLAELGFVVARINHRGTSGLGLAHRNALRLIGERAPVADALAVIEWVAARHAIDRRRVATIGHGFGGYLALRAAQLEPGVVRCAIAIDAIVDPEAWLRPHDLPVRHAAGFGRSDGSLPASFAPTALNFHQEASRRFLFGGATRLASVLDHAETLQKPLLLIVNPPPDSIIALQNDALRSRLARLGRPPAMLVADHPDGRELPGAQTKRFRRISEFLNLNLYDFGVKVGPTEVVK